MAQHHIDHAMMRRALGWPSVESLIRRATLLWLGHVARMGRDRLPCSGHEARHEGASSQFLWLCRVLRESGIPEMDWIRLAQSKGKSGRWQNIQVKIYR